MTPPLPAPTYPALEIAYLTEGEQRGYNFTSIAATRRYADDTLKHIWRQAMPRGQGWNAVVGAQSLKCFTLPDQRVVLSQVTVTDRQDESGRRGIRHAVIHVYARHEYEPALRTLLTALPDGVRRDADAALAFWQKTRSLERSSGKLRRAGQLVFTHPYSTPADWQVMEAVLLKLTLNPPGVLRTAGIIPAFTTLALDHREESGLVGLPASHTGKVKLQETPVIPV